MEDYDSESVNPRASIAPPPKPDWEESSDVPASDMPLLSGDIFSEDLNSQELTHSQEGMVHTAETDGSSRGEFPTQALASKLSDTRCLETDSYENTMTSVPDLDEDNSTQNRALLQDQDVPDLSDSLTEAMMTKAKSGMSARNISECSDARDGLEELNQSDLASLIQEVTSASRVSPAPFSTIDSTGLSHDTYNDEAIFKVPRYTPAVSPRAQSRIGEISNESDVAFGSETQMESEHRNSDFSSDQPKRKRGRPPKSKSDEQVLPCARTVPYSWKNKTREEKLAGYKRLLNAERDSIQETSKKNVSPGNKHNSDTHRVHKKITNAPSTLTCSDDERGHFGGGTFPSNQPIQPALLPDYHEFQRPHVSPDSGISSGGSPHPAVSSPHQMAVHHFPSFDGIRTQVSQGSDFYDALRVQPTDDVSNQKGVGSSHENSSVHSSQVSVSNTKTNSLAETNIPVKRGRKPNKHLMRNDKQNSTNNTTATNQNLEPKVRKRGRPKGSLNKKTLLNKANGISSVKSLAETSPPKQDNIFERLHDISSDSLHTFDIGSENQTSTKTKRTLKSRTVIPSKQSAIAAHISKALKSAKMNVKDNAKKKRGRPRINPVVKRPRGRPRKKGIAQPEVSTGFPRSHTQISSPSLVPGIQQEQLSMTASGTDYAQSEPVSIPETALYNPLSHDYSQIHNRSFTSERAQHNAKQPKIDEFDKLVQSVHRISSKFHHRVTETEQIEDTASTDSESELTNGVSLADSKVVPNIRQSRLDVHKKHGKKRKSLLDVPGLCPNNSDQSEYGGQVSNFSLPPGAYAFHRHTSPNAKQMETLHESQEGTLEMLSHSPTFSNCSEQLKQTSQKSPAALVSVSSPNALPMSPCSTTDSHVSAKDIPETETHKKKQKKKKSKHFKSKHKNVVDPVFVAEVDNLATDILSLKISDKAQSSSAESNIAPFAFQISKAASKESPDSPLTESQLNHQDVELQSTSTTAAMSGVSKHKKGRKRRHIQDGLDMIRKPKHHSLPTKKKLKQLVDDDQEDGEETSLVENEPATQTEVEESPPPKKRGRPKKNPCYDTPAEDQTRTVPTEPNHDDFSAFVEEVSPKLHDENQRPRSRSFGKRNSSRSSERQKIPDTPKSINEKRSPNVNESNIMTDEPLNNNEVQSNTVKKKGRRRKYPLENPKDPLNETQQSLKCNNEDTENNLVKSAPSEAKEQATAKSVDLTTCVSIGTDKFPETSNEKCGSGEIAIQADFDIQCDLEDGLQSNSPNDKPKKKGIDIGVQAYPEELIALAKQAEEETRRKSQSEIAIQVDNDTEFERQEMPKSRAKKVSQPLEIQVNFDAEDLDSGINSSERAHHTPVCRRSPRSHPSPFTPTKRSNFTPPIRSPRQTLEKTGAYFSPAYSDISSASRTSNNDSIISMDTPHIELLTNVIDNAEESRKNLDASKSFNLTESGKRSTVIESVSPKEKDKAKFKTQSVIQKSEKDKPLTSSIDPHTSVIRRAEKQSVSPHRPPMHSNQPAFQAAFESFLSTGPPVQSPPRKKNTRSRRRSVSDDLSDEALLSTAYANGNYTIEDNTQITEETFDDFGDDFIDDDGKLASDDKTTPITIAPVNSTTDGEHSGVDKKRAQRKRQKSKGWGNRKKRPQSKRSATDSLKDSENRVNESFQNQAEISKDSGVPDQSFDTNLDSSIINSKTAETIESSNVGKDNNKDQSREEKGKREAELNSLEISEKVCNTIENVEVKGTEKYTKRKSRSRSRRRRWKFPPDELDEMADAVDTSMDTSFDRPDHTITDPDISKDPKRQPDFELNTTRECSPKSHPSSSKRKHSKRHSSVETTATSLDSSLDITLDETKFMDRRSSCRKSKLRSSSKLKEASPTKVGSVKDNSPGEGASDSVLDVSVMITSEKIAPDQKKDIIVIGSDTDCERVFDAKQCPDCRYLQKKGKSSKRRCQLHKKSKKKIQKKSNSGHQSGTESDKDCVVVLERLQSGEQKRKRSKSKESKSNKAVILRSKNSTRPTRVHKKICDSSATESKKSDTKTSLTVSENESHNTTSDLSYKTGDSQANTTDTLTGQEISINLDTSLEDTTCVIDTTVGNTSINTTANTLNITPDGSPDYGAQKRKNTNSEYDPLPIIKKKKALRNDMGYSQPRKKRRKKKADANTPTGDTTRGTDGAEEEEEEPLPAHEEDESYLSLEEDSSQYNTETDSVSGSRPGTPAKRGADGSILPRKRFQRAGLFSEVFKSSEAFKRILKKPDLKIDVYNPDDYESGLMPDPIHIGKYLREKRIDFALPYDVWYLHEHDLLKPVKLPSPKYRKIRHNVYVDCKGISKHETHSCNCQKPQNAKERSCYPDSCLNRMIYTECNPASCPAGDHCCNNRIQKSETVPGLEKFKTADRGYGVRSKMPIETGDFIVEYIGEVITEKEFQRRMHEDYSKDNHHYALNLDSGLVIDGYRMGNLSRFVNHSCEPNCEMQKWNVNGYYRMALFAIKNIPAGTEVTYDYNFHSYNAQQECKCGSSQCRGVLGGRAVHQRLNGIVKEKSGNSPSKDKRKSKHRKQRDKEKLEVQRSGQQQTPVKPLSHRERCFVQKQGVFLLRNLNKIRQQKHKSTPTTPISENQDPLEVFHTNFVALNTARTVRTRGLSTAQDNAQLAKMAQLAQILQIIYLSVASYKDETGVLLSEPLEHCPKRKTNPDYYEIIKEPIDLKQIENKVLKGHYRSLESFEADFLKLFRNVERYCGKESEIGKAVAELEKVFFTAKNEATADLFKEEPYTSSSSAAPSVSETPATSAASECDSSVEVSTVDGDTAGEEEEEIIRCVCNIYRDEGLMMQCEKCETWQHCDCMDNPDSSKKYMCEICDPRPLSREVTMKELPEDAKPDCTYYITLLRDETLQVRIGDCYYVMKEALTEKNRVKAKPRYDELALNPDALCIFRIDRLWKDKSGRKYAFGHHYLRPHETFHEVSRKFFAKEVFRIPLYEIIPIEAIVKHCLVMDVNSYCRGRPKGVNESDVYVCEFRLDKTARFFKKISKQNYPINMKRYCFDRFPTKLNPKRTYSPFEVPEKFKKHSSRSTSDNTSESGKSLASDVTIATAYEDDDMPLARIKQQQKTAKKKTRLLGFCNKLMENLDTTDVLDVTYLLEANKKRNKKR